MSGEDKHTVKLTKPATLTFSQSLFEARAIGPKGREQGAPKYSSNFELELESADVGILKAEAVKVAKERWPGRDLKELKFPFAMGDVLADKAKKNGKDREFSRGKFVVISRSKFQPQLSYVEGGRIIELEGEAAIQAAKGKFYMGSLSLAEFNLVAYDGVGANPDGVTAYLNKVCSLNRGTRIKGGGSSSAETFKDYIGTETDYDPSAGLDEELAF